MTTSLIQLPVLRIASQPHRLRSETYPFHTLFEIRWSDLQDERVSRVAIAHFFEDMRVVMMRNMLGAARFGTESWKAVLRAITVEHLALAKLQPALQLAGGISAIGNSSYSFALGVFQQGQCIALGNAVSLRVGENGRPEALGLEVREALLRGMLLTQDESI